VQRTITFPVVVTAADADGDTTRLEAKNAQTWEIAGTGLHMRAGAGAPTPSRWTASTYQLRRDELLSCDDKRLARLDTGPAQHGMHDATRPLSAVCEAPKSRSGAQLRHRREPLRHAAARNGC
jgi:hypothetical protein